MSHIVTVNEGFTSAEMSPYQAVLFARQLEELGNYNIRVTEVKHGLLSHKDREMEK